MCSSVNDWQGERRKEDNNDYAVRPDTLASRTQNTREGDPETPRVSLKTKREDLDGLLLPTRIVSYKSMC